jgi:stress-induced-phosphoprotein 1
MGQKDQANQYFKDGNYNQSVQLYTEILELDEDNFAVLSNRSAAYLKLEKYDLALVDAVKTTKLKPEWGKAWGRLGAALYGLEKLDESLVAYNKANELEPSDIYAQMLDQIKAQLKEMKVVNPKVQLIGENMDNLLNKLYDSMFSNSKIMEKLSDPEFQNKVLSLQNNPFDAIKDKEIMGLMSEMMKNIRL